MAVYEGKWRCLRCSTANLGRNLNCLTCGVKRSDDVEFFLDTDAPAVADADLLNQANAGADWICRYCSGNNRAFERQCSSCGSRRSEQDEQLIEETRGINDWSEAAQKAARQAAQAQSLQSSQPKKSFFSSRFFKDKYCERTKYKTVTRTRNRTETVYRDVPVYKIRYKYLIDKWVAAGEKTTSGTDFNPQWATVQTDNVRTREGKRTESYNLICKELGGDNKLHKINLTAENWSKFKSGEHLHGKTNFFGDLVSIDELPDYKK
jgi:hypothetical protein